MVLACERDLELRVHCAELDIPQSGVPPGAQLLDFLGPLGIAGAYLIY